MSGQILVLFGGLVGFSLVQGQKSITENPKKNSNSAIDLSKLPPYEKQSKENGTNLTIQDFVNGQNLKNSTSLQEAKKIMQLTLKNKPVIERDKAQFGKDRSVQQEVKYRWPNGEVPYVVENVFDADERALIASAIQNIQDNSCVTFRPALSSDADYVYIFTTNASGCTGHRYLGPGYGEHHLNLEGDSGDGLTCINRGVIIHELMHMLGFAHEHQRPDRDTMVTVNWANVEVEKAHNLFRDSFSTEDITKVPICNNTGVLQADSDFSDCVSGDVVTAYGVGYDFYSLMHYEFDSFALNSGAPVMVPFDTSITSPGNVELSAMDIAKLQKAYGCNGCGGYKRSSVGGTISGDGTSDLLSPCAWVLETVGGQGIIIEITDLIGSDCSTDYVEVRIGSSSEGQLVGRYCAESVPGPVKVASSTVWVQWGKSEDSSSMAATWSTYEVQCCQSVVLENIENLPTLTFNLTDQKIGDHVLYKIVDGVTDVYYLYWYPPHGWFIGTDPTSTSIVALNKGQTLCPAESTETWEYATSDGLVPDQDANLRCSDCTLYPSRPECEDCCDRVTLTSTFSEFHDPSQYYSQFFGQFAHAGAVHNNHKVYQSSIFASACLFFSNSGNWIIMSCADLNTGSRWIQAPGTKCVHQATGWVIFSQTTGEDVSDESLSFDCIGKTTTAAKTKTTKMTTTPLSSTTTSTTINTSTTTIKPSTNPLITESPTTLPVCQVCKYIEGGPMNGTYVLEDMSTSDQRCVDGCVYVKGEDLYCFAEGEDIVTGCT